MIGSYKALVVDDEPFVQGFCCDILALEGMEVFAASNGQTALKLLNQHEIELVLLDLKLPDISGLEVLAYIAKYHRHLSTIIMTGHATMDTAISAQTLGAEGFVLKPFDDEQLLQLIDQVLERRRLRQDYARLKSHVPLLALGHRLMTEPDIDRLAHAVLEIIQQTLQVVGATLWVGMTPLAHLGQTTPPPPFEVKQAAWLMVDEQHQLTNIVKEAQSLYFALKTEKGYIGCLTLFNASKGKFSGSDVEFLTVISSHLAIGLENRNLYHTIEMAHKELEAIFDTIQDAILVHDEHGVITRVNRPMIEWLGVRFQDIIGQPASKVKIDEWGQNLCELGCVELADHPQSAVKPVEFQAPPWAKNSLFRLKTFPLYRHGMLVEVIHVLEDVTQAHKLQAQWIQTEKLSALGRLSASLAHEINNPLQALRSGLRLLSKPALPEEKQHQYVAMLSDEVDRLVNLTTRTLNFARPDQVGKAETDLHTLLEETLTLVHKQLQKQQISLTRQYTENLPLIYVVPAQIKQVCLNLILNSLDAMPHGGQLTIATAITEQELYLSISDNGPGISPEVLPHISEPFFTTKEAGTGLGLSISYSIIEAHGGQIEVQSTLGVGCLFRIMLPR